MNGVFFHGWANVSGGNALRLLIYWLVVGIPLLWGIWNTILKLPALFR